MARSKDSLPLQGKLQYTEHLKAAMNFLFMRMLMCIVQGYWPGHSGTIGRLLIVLCGRPGPNHQCLPPLPVLPPQQQQQQDGIHHPLYLMWWYHCGGAG